MAIFGPTPVDENNWYYEYPTYLLLVHEVKARDGKHIKTDQIKLSWRSLNLSMKRSYRPRKRKSA